MKTSLNDIQLIELHLHGGLKPKEAAAFYARLAVEPLLRLQVGFQQKVYSLIKMYAHRKLKSEIEAVHQRIFRDPERIAFQQNVLRLFHA